MGSTMFDADELFCECQDAGFAGTASVVLVDNKGRDVRAKLDVCPSGGIDDDESWQTAAAEGLSFTVSRGKKNGRGGKRSKSIKRVTGDVASGTLAKMFGIAVEAE